MRVSRFRVWAAASKRVSSTKSSYFTPKGDGKGYSDLIDSGEIAFMGISGYLIKPVSRRDLAQVVRKVLDATRTG